MGMYDSVQYNNQLFQTKSLDNEMATYKIEDAVLWKDCGDVKWVEGGRFGGYLEKVNEKWVVCSDITEQLCFYRKTDRTYSKWEEYTAEIVNGRVVSITRDDVEDRWNSGSV